MKKVFFIFLCFTVALLFSPVVDLTTAETASKVESQGCQCGPDCQCEHCKTGTGECLCKAGHGGCSCGPNCGCEHCRTGVGECKCGS